MSDPTVTVPEPEGLALEFHHASIAGKALHLQRCDACGTFRHPPRRYCPSCFSDDYTFTETGGRGILYSFVVSHRTFDPGWVEQVPFVTAAVQMDEGPRVVCALRGGPGEGVKLGVPVHVTVEPKGDDFAFLWAELG